MQIHKYESILIPQFRVGHPSHCASADHMDRSVSHLIDITHPILSRRVEKTAAGTYGWSRVHRSDRLVGMCPNNVEAEVDR